MVDVGAREWWTLELCGRLSGIVKPRRNDSGDVKVKEMKRDRECPIPDLLMDPQASWRLCKATRSGTC